MYAGRIAEIGPVKDIIQNALHPYTAGLMGSIPSLTQEENRLVQIPGAMPRLADMPSGCAFHPRCERVFEHCKRHRPELISVGTHEVSCWLYKEAGGEATTP